MSVKKILTPSLEDYLETVLRLEEKNRVARVRDIALMLDVQMPSVTGALKSLKEKGLVQYEKNSFIVLTERGKVIAEGIYAKHKVILDFLRNVLLLPEEKAVEQACQIEHVIDDDTAGRLCNCMQGLAALWEREQGYTAKEWEALITAPNSACSKV